MYAILSVNLCLSPDLHKVLEEYLDQQQNITQWHQKLYDNIHIHNLWIITAVNISMSMR
jgi:hypothetical protein